MEPRTIWHNQNDSWVGPAGLFSENELIIRTLFSLVSHGTERTMITQKLTREVADNMSVPYMERELNDQFTYGYSLVGQVQAGPDHLKGKIVHLMHPHQDFVSVKASDVFVVPDGIDPKVATLASNLETVINALWDSEIELGDRVLIAGYGLIGALLATFIHRMPGISYEILESDSNRIKLIKKHGHPLYGDVKGSPGYDLVFNTTGSGEVLQKAFKITSREGKIIELSWFGTGSTTLELGSDFHYGRKKIISSQVSNIPFRKQGKWDYHKRKVLVFNLLSDLGFSHLIDQVIRFDEAPQFFGKLRKGAVKNLSTVIKY